MKDGRSPAVAPAPAPGRASAPAAAKPSAPRDRRLSKEGDLQVTGGDGAPSRPGGRDRRLSKEGDLHVTGDSAVEPVPTTGTALAAQANAAATNILHIATDPDEDKAPAAGDSNDGGSLKSPLLHGSILGVYSCRGRDGRRYKVNQDAASVAHPLGADAGSALLTVLDGHGPEGAPVSGQVLRSLNFELDTRCTPERLQKDPASAISTAFESVQSQLAACAAQAAKTGATGGGGGGPKGVGAAAGASSPAVAAPVVDARESGACSLVAYIRERTLWVASAGDCCCVLATSVPGADATSGGKGGGGKGDTPPLRALKLSVEHKVDLPSEKKRIEAIGGWVRDAEYDEIGLVNPARMYRMRGEDNRSKGPGLAISRSIGDLSAVPCGMSATPEVISRPLRTGASSGGEDAFLILASDGVWEFLSEQDAVDIVTPFYEDAAAKGGKGGRQAQAACRALIERSKTEWETEGTYRDDISAIVVFLPAFLRILEEGGKAKEEAKNP